MSSSAISQEGFELFLEGRQVSFSSIALTEVENRFPELVVSFTADSDATRILPSTIVQLFGPFNGNKVLMFEGEVSGLSYEKGTNGRIVSLQCRHLLSRTIDATLRPKDSLLSDRRKASDGLFAGGNKVIVYDSSETLSAELIVAETIRKSNTEQAELSDIEISSFAPFALAFFQIMEGKTEGGEKILNGELNYLFDFFFDYYEKHEIFYKTISKGFKLRNSIFAWPNHDRINLFKTKAVYEQTESIMSNISAKKSDTSVRLFDLMQKSMYSFRYSMLCPASPTHVKQFWEGADEEGPLRLQFSPSLEHSPPLLANTFFPDQITNLSFRRPMLAEPTRVIGSFTVPTTSPVLQTYGITPISVAPQLGITEEVLKANTVPYTLEESYRGVKPAYINLNYFLTDTFLEKAIEDNNQNNPDLTQIPKESFAFGSNSEASYKGFGTAFHQATYDQYLALKYGQRVCSFSGAWNPSRMVGFPALVVETNGPSIYGVVSSIDTVITGTGTATSTYTLREPRFIRAYEENEDLINSYVDEGILDLNYYLFDPQLYNFTKIGGDLYNFNTYGRGTIDGVGLHKDADYPGLASYKDNIKNILNSPEVDSSVLKFIKNNKGDIVNSEVDLEGPAQKVYSGLLQQSVSKLIDFYKEFKDRTPTDQLIPELNILWARNLTTKKQYFDYLEVELNPRGTEVISDSYKELEKILTELKNIKSFKDEDPEESLESEAIKAYNKKRRAHVDKAFENTVTQRNIKVIGNSGKS